LARKLQRNCGVQHTSEVDDACEATTALAVATVRDSGRLTD